MRKLGCFFGWLFALATFAVTAWEFFARDPEKGFLLRPAGELWKRIDLGSLVLVQAVIERYIWPPLWDQVVFKLLLLPSIVIPLVPALVLLTLCYLRARPRQARRKPPPAVRRDHRRGRAARAAWRKPPARGWHHALPRICLTASSVDHSALAI